ncbi:efflux RND transporter periplasmic adaptor subunit [Maribacter sp. ACAM166]|uniref:efflux RND transporter periplasmic adaptor subunit n=1 Tax=Maribacter sp. ACAM166 TaxID=2508996 RepID=UPI0010FE9866|nr:efflux RND transporter periplasmic adaptor subunit [Maribacter sp. ACAM166]TLP81759.1 efflux RND transporter periplasmic adaptor subunit [Maribacter sp. ACAM166]
MKKSTWIILGILVLAVVGYLILKPKLNTKKLDFTYTALEKGNIEADVSSTGTVEAINTVEIGTQISGTIIKIYVDYNDRVHAGQVLAEMDLKLLNTNLNSAQANLAVSEAQLYQAKDEYERNQTLYEKSVISNKEYTNSKYAYNQALSAKKAAAAAVKNIQVSMGYAHITSPINGTVIERSVEEGQTVAASFATPTMFIIAEDLSKMQILADMDESDIGYIKDSMQVRFTVQTYPEKKFYGVVSQIRLQPIEINNVVNYQVVVDVDNKKGLLLPGMTANLEFITAIAKDVLLINNSALRFRPNEVMLEEIKPVLEEKAAAMLPDSLQAKFNSGINSEELYTPINYKKNLPRNIDGFFYQNEQGKLDFKFVEIGIKTGLQSEIKRFLDGSDLSEGSKAINGIKSKK